MLASGLLLAAIFFCLSALVVLSVWKQRKIRSSLPPGPTPLPFIGNYLQLNTQQMYDSLMKIGEKFGPVFTVHLGQRAVVVLTGYEAVKEALVDQAEEFSGRGEQATFDWLFKGFGECLGRDQANVAFPRLLAEAVLGGVVTYWDEIWVQRGKYCAAWRGTAESKLSLSSLLLYVLRRPQTPPP
ncbi:cytochrome P450 2A11-like, partial [Vombatus ursinus]|uniref:cytochrome P450 2A11-like n=1 Tax=Vombatus ursinus TaxID=29139 RepID=UPI000FFCEC64